MNVSAVVTGDDAIVVRLNGRRAEGPQRRFLARSAFTIEGHAKVNASGNVFTGAGRASIEGHVDSPSRAHAGTNQRHMFFLHEGTRPHFPPIAAIAPWARAKGADPFLVARGIARHGTKAHPFLRDALRQSEGQIRGFLPILTREIVAGMAG